MSTYTEFSNSCPSLEDDYGLKMMVTSLVSKTLECCALRYIVVCHPLRARAFCQQRRAKLIIIGTVFVFTLVNFHMLFSTAIVEVEENRPKTNLPKTSGSTFVRQMTCGPRPGYGFLVNVVWPWVDAILYGLGPFILISILNSVIIIKVSSFRF
ncbi:FMRFamide receptor [Plakobranchus ocellatus]|uniref:FMRFamide receptor n=1 Tax=Plakobranchus ocellatus TaxID=259542 RepID=A0AAV4DGI8_9GAST|nr:FMRFamide receptor [Plakobranchus ocellatus]